MSNRKDPPERETALPRQGRRDDILAAAIASIVSEGYGRISMSQVARRAEVGRPLVQYYFPTRELLLRAAIERILDDWRDRYLEPPRQAQEKADIGAGIDRLWRHMHEPTFRAYQELHSAARTDPELRAIIDELDADAAHRRHAQAAGIYAAFVSADPAAFTDARAFTTIFLEGLLQHRFGPPGESSTAHRQLAMLTGLLIHYWSQHGIASNPTPPDPAPPRYSPEIRHHATELIARLETLVKSLG